MQKIDEIYAHLPDCAVSSDIIAGFCTETEEEHQDTLSLMEYAGFSMSYMFCYSERPGTLAAKKFADDIPIEVKKRRLNEVIALQNKLSAAHNARDVGRTFEILVEGKSRKSEKQWKGRNSQNKMVVFEDKGDVSPGDYVHVKINASTSATLIGEQVNP